MKRNRIIEATLSVIVCGALVAPAALAAVPALAASTPASVMAAAAAAQATPAAAVETPALKPAPVLVVSSYKTTKDRLLVGSAFTLTLNVRNETARRAENVVVSLASASSAGTGEAGAAAGGLTVLGTGNAKYLGQLRGKTTEAVSFKAVAGPGTPPGATTVPVTISFEYDGERHDLAYTIGLVFDRAAGLTVSAAEIPKTARVGKSFDASFELANSGSFTVPGMSMSVETTGGTVADANLFVGAFEAAAAETIDVSITPKKAGPMQVVLVAKYHDDFGRDKVYRSVHTVNVQGEPKATGDSTKTDTKEAKQDGNWLTRFFKALFGMGA